jgi:hypothetical protein
MRLFRSRVPTPNSTLLNAAEQRQGIQFNPTAALQKAIFAAGFVPNSGEFNVTHDGTAYIGQRAEYLATGDGGFISPWMARLDSCKARASAYRPSARNVKPRKFWV